MQGTLALFYIVVLIFSVVIHEIAHGYVAYRLGDQTARIAGRLTLNPLRHIDLFGSIILPLILVITKAGFVLGWAKPVPYNPANLSNKRWGTAMVASAGVLANFSIALVFALIVRISPYIGLLSRPFLEITSLIIFTNIALGVFNLIPLPPLDGSKILFSILPPSARGLENTLETYALPLIILFVVVFSKFLIPVISFLYTLFTGISI